MCKPATPPQASETPRAHAATLASLPPYSSTTLPTLGDDVEAPTTDPGGMLVSRVPTVDATGPLRGTTIGTPAPAVAGGCCSPALLLLPRSTAGFADAAAAAVVAGGGVGVFGAVLLPAALPRPFGSCRGGGCATGSFEDTLTAVEGAVTCSSLRWGLYNAAKHRRSTDRGTLPLAVSVIE